MNQSILQYLYNQLHYQFSQLILKRELEEICLIIILINIKNL